MRELFYHFQFDVQEFECLEAAHRYQEQYLQQQVPVTLGFLEHCMRQDGHLGDLSGRQFARLVRQGLLAGRLDWSLCPPVLDEYQAGGSVELWVQGLEAANLLRGFRERWAFGLVPAGLEGWNIHQCYSAAGRLEGRAARLLFWGRAPTAQRTYRWLERMLQVRQARELFNARVGRTLWLPERFADPRSRYTRRVRQALADGLQIIRGRIQYRVLGAAVQGSALDPLAARAELAQVFAEPATGQRCDASHCCQ